MAASESPTARKLRHLRDSLRQGLGVCLAVLLSVLGRPSAITLAAGAALVVLGVGIRLWASGHIQKNRRLATGGPYRWVRHPLYVGNLLLTVGFCLASGRWWAWPVMLFFWLVFYPNAIDEEDRKLEGLFGDEWRAWRRRTPALLPGRLSDGGQPDSRWRLANSVRLNGEPIIALILLTCLAALFRRLVLG